MTSIQVLISMYKIWAIPRVLILYLYISGSKTRARAYQEITFERADVEFFLSKMKQGTYLGSFAGNGSVEAYLRNNPVPTETEDEVQNWFNDLMPELPK